MDKDKIVIGYEKYTFVVTYTLHRFVLHKMSQREMKNNYFGLGFQRLRVKIFLHLFSKDMLDKPEEFRCQPECILF